MNLRSVLPGGHGRRLRVRRVAAMVAAVSVMMIGGIAVAASTASATQPDPAHKDYVCKYVGKPGDGERLQTGNNPIWVDTAATAPGWYADLFNDAQGRSYVIVADTLKLDPEPGIDQCAPPAPAAVTAPTFTPGTCTAVGSFVLPESDSYDWVSSGPETARIVTAVANEGFTLTGTTTFGPFDLTTLPQLASAACPQLKTVTSPTLTVGTCEAPGSFVLPESDFYSWTHEGADNAISYTAVAKAGFTLTGTTTFGPFDLTKLPKLAPESAACFVPTVLGEVVTAPNKGAVVTSAPVVAGAQVTRLAFTGAETVPLGLSGLIALLLGAGLIATTRRQGRRANN